tara:strand:- start:853 stop:1335 length:483 start_codon:yes stop_codon:yes gene_type:complete
MSQSVENTWAYYISGRNIHLYKLSSSGASENATYRVRVPEFDNQTKLIYPNEAIAAGLMFEGTAFIAPFVEEEPNELADNSQPTLTEVATSDVNEVHHINSNRMLSLACVDYVKGMLAEREGDINKKEYFMKEFFSKLSDSESNKRNNVTIQPVSPYALR